jgi:uncharacterized protein (TIGR02453 family)
MGYFTDDYLSFFRELNAYNSKAWFDKNRNRYEKCVKQPFTALVEEMIVRIHSDNPDVVISPSEAIFRINRDIRFTKDKTPYKTHMGALISPAGRKAKNIPGFYFQIGKDGIRIYSGVHNLGKNEIQEVRKYLAENLDMFDKIINNKKFKSCFHEICGEKNRKLPPEFKNAYEKQPLIANKDYYVFTDIDSKYTTDLHLADKLMGYYYTAKPLMEFLTKALKP